MGEIKENKYLAGEIEGKFFIKFIGNATMRNSKTIDELLEKLLKEEAKDVIFDLEECNYMDSTMLGLIAKTAIKIKKNWKRTLYVLNTSNMIKSSFKSTGVNKLLEFIESESIKEESIEELEMKDFENKESKTKHILEAHKTLMGLTDENKKVFKNVVTLLEKELE